MKAESDIKIIYFFLFSTGDEEVSVSSALKGQLELEENCASGVKKAGERHHYHGIQNLR